MAEQYVALSGESATYIAENVIFNCRPGYEKDASDEVTALAARIDLFGYPTFNKASGFFCFHFYSQEDAQRFCETYRVDDLIFSRQYFHGLIKINQLPKQDRVGVVINALTHFKTSRLLDTLLSGRFGSVSLDYPDTEDGKQVAKFAKKFQVPLRQAGRKRAMLDRQENRQKPMLHVFMQDFETWIIGVSFFKHRNEHHNGIHRLKFPPAAPSRSTLKLEEAFKTLLDDRARELYLREGARAVDLGACPGGWTYQLVQKGMYVEAVDNGQMAESVMQTGLVSYKAVDGFKYQPEYGCVDIVVCDMIEHPDRVVRLLTQWLTKPYAKAAVFNLKLPMKKRYTIVISLLELITQQLKANSKTQFRIRCKHLYHNRDEVTVSVLPH